MPTIRMRLTGSRDDADVLLNTLHGIDGIEHVEELDDQAQAMRDDSSSSELVDDNGSNLFFIEVRAADRLHEQIVRSVAELKARARGNVLEFVDDF